jgi:type II secretory pathway predicted ATPase ExeA
LRLFVSEFFQRCGAEYFHTTFSNAIGKVSFAFDNSKYFSKLAQHHKNRSKKDFCHSKLVLSGIFGKHSARFTQVKLRRSKKSFASRRISLDHSLLLPYTHEALTRTSRRIHIWRQNDGVKKMKPLLDFFQLSSNPFGDTPNTDFLYPSPAHREAFASLVWAIQAGRGFVGLTAVPGMGKTTLLFHLMRTLEGHATTAFVFQTQCSPSEMLRYLVTDLGIPADPDPVVLHARLKDFLTEQARLGKRVVLIVDEAQNLHDSVLEMLRLISDFETEHRKLVQIVLAGQPELAARLNSPALEQLRQRISPLAHIEPLTPVEVAHYVQHRLATAGRADQSIFTAESIALIAQASRGIPREINTISFSALSLAFVARKRQIDASIIREALADRQTPSQTHMLATRKSKIESPAYTKWLGFAAALIFSVLALQLVAWNHSDIKLPPRHTLARPSKTPATSPTRLTPLPPQTLLPSPPVAAASLLPVSLPLTPSPSPDTITVLPGQTLYSLSRLYLGNANPETLAAICALNDTPGCPSIIQAGQTLKLPHQPAK